MYFRKIIYEIDINKGIFRPDSGSLALTRTALTHKGKFLDLGTGSGFISIALFLNGYTGDCSDISHSAIDCTKNNFRKFGIECEPIYSDLYNNISGKYDIIIFSPFSNTPESEFNRLFKNFVKQILPERLENYFGKIFQSINRKKRLNFLKEFIGITKNYLNENGVLIMNPLIKDAEIIISGNNKYKIREVIITDYTTVLEIKYNLI
jgi:methylase of polypeptide subunit release factors